MTNILDTVHLHMRALVLRIGCYDAAAETISARWGRGVSKGTISKLMSGGLDWRLVDVIAIEDVLGWYPVTRLLAQRMADHEREKDVPLMEHAGSISFEVGEAVVALLAAEQSNRAQDHTQAIKELQDVVAAAQGAIATLKKRGKRNG